MAGAVRAKPGADDSPSGVQKKQVRDAHDVTRERALWKRRGGKRKDAASWQTNCGRRTAASRSRTQSSTGWPRADRCAA
eukprot:6302393-Prymnesium_polylepis.1